MEEKVFANGIIFKLPSEKAPDFVRGSISFKTDEAIQWIKEHTENGWCNIDLKVGKPKEGQPGKPYAELNTWKPKEQGSGDYSPKTDPKYRPFEDDDVTF